MQLRSCLPCKESQGAGVLSRIHRTKYSKEVLRVSHAVRSREICKNQKRNKSVMASITFFFF